MDLGADGWQTFRLVTLPDDLDGADLGRAARVRALVRRGDRDHVHRRRAEHAADLDLRQDPARPGAAAGERRRLRRSSCLTIVPVVARPAADARERHPPHGGLGGARWPTSDAADPHRRRVDRRRVGRDDGGAEPGDGGDDREVPRCGAEDVDAAVEAAKAALPEWLETTPGERAEVLLKLADVIDAQRRGARRDRVAQRRQAALATRATRCRSAADNLRFFAGAARLLEGKSAGEYMRGYTSFIRREPLGSSAGSRPWNYPLMMAVWKLAPALAAGNVQVLKPSEQTPLSLLRFARARAGRDPGRRAERRHRRRRPGRRAHRHAP